MTAMQTPFIPPSKVGSEVASSPLHPPLHPPSAIYPHTPRGCAPALRGGARPAGGADLVPMPGAWERGGTRSGLLLSLSRPSGKKLGGNVDG